MRYIYIPLTANGSKFYIFNVYANYNSKADTDLIWLPVRTVDAYLVHITVHKTSDPSDIDTDAIYLIWGDTWERIAGSAKMNSWRHMSDGSGMVKKYLMLSNDNSMKVIVWNLLYTT